MSLASESHDSSEAVSLMSFDAEGLDDLPEMIHELWAHILEVVIGIVMLSREVGRIWPLPLVLIFCLSACFTCLIPMVLTQFIAVCF